MRIRGYTHWLALSAVLVAGFACYCSQGAEGLRQPAVVVGSGGSASHSGSACVSRSLDDEQSTPVIQRVAYWGEQAPEHASGESASGSLLVSGIVPIAPQAAPEIRRLPSATIGFPETLGADEPLPPPYPVKRISPDDRLVNRGKVTATRVVRAGTGQIPSSSVPSVPVQLSAVPQGGSGLRDDSVHFSAGLDETLAGAWHPVALPVEVATRSQSLLKEATTLANRGAQFAARAEFERIMRLTCQALDAQIGRPVHSRAFARGLRALEEAEDFTLRGDSADSDLHLRGFIEGHRTPVLKGLPDGEITALRAMQSYYAYAVEQLSIAANKEAVSSQTLCALGRIESLLSRQQGANVGSGPKALAFYYAALATDPRNGRAANELAVMLARRGRHVQAEQLFRQALATEPMALVNLATTYRRLGNVKLAAYYSAQVRQMAARHPELYQHGPSSGVRWVNHATFLREGAGSDFSPASTPIRTVGDASQGNHRAASDLVQPADRSARSVKKPSIKERIKAPRIWSR